MKKLLFILLLMASASSAEEKISLSSPFQPDTRTASDFNVCGINMENEPGNIPLVSVRLCAGDIRRNFHWTGDTARTMMIALNKANLSSNSLHKRILDRLVQEGRLDGSVSGTPD